MNSFQKVTLPPEYYDPHVYARQFQVDMPSALDMVWQVMSESVYSNGEYIVNVSQPMDSGVEGWPQVIHVAVRRVDTEPVRSWDVLQAIKNRFVGEENEAVEVFPAEARLVNMANQSHLWAFVDPEFRLPFGWSQRMVR